MYARKRRESSGVCIVMWLRWSLYVCRVSDEWLNLYVRFSVLRQSRWWDYQACLVLTAISVDTPSLNFWINSAIARYSASFESLSARSNWLVSSVFNHLDIYSMIVFIIYIDRVPWSQWTRCTQNNAKWMHTLNRSPSSVVSTEIRLQWPIGTCVTHASKRG